MAKFSHKDIDAELEEAMEAVSPISKVMAALDAAKARGGSEEISAGVPAPEGQVGVGSPLGSPTGTPKRTVVPDSGL